MRRRTVVAVATTLTMLSLVASVQAALAVLAAPGPVDRISKADMARARASVLRSSDVFSNFTPTTSAVRQPTIAHCNGYPGDRSDVTVTGEARSAFKMGAYSIGSTVLWFKTAADANRYWTKTVRPQYIRCRADLLRLANGAGETVRPFITQAAAVGLRPTGAQKAVAYRLIAGVPATAGPGNDSYNFIDTNVFIKVGRSIGLLRTVWITSPCDCYHDLARVLAKRLRAAQ
jgi:hypothetical protein